MLKVTPKNQIVAFVFDDTNAQEIIDYLAQNTNIRGSLFSGYLDIFTANTLDSRGVFINSLYFGNVLVIQDADNISFLTYIDFDKLYQVV